MTNDDRRAPRPAPRSNPMTALAHPLPGPNSAADVLRHAADAYRTGTIRLGRKWFVREGDTRFRCSLGAITYAIDPDREDGNPTFAGPLGKAATLILADHVIDIGAPRCVEWGGYDPVETVGGWNDLESTTVEDVIAALDAAATRLDAAPTGGAA